MGLLTGVVERVPAAYCSDERQTILESLRPFGHIRVWKLMPDGRARGARARATVDR